MKKTTTILLEPFILYLEDLEEIDKLLTTGGYKFRYFLDDENSKYYFDSLKELLSYKKWNIVKSISIYTSSAPISICLGATPFISIEGNSHAAMGEAYAIKEICNRHPFYKNRFFKSKWPMIISAIFASVIIAIKIKTPPEFLPEKLFIILSAICAILNVFFLYTQLSIQVKGHCRICLYHYNEKPQNIFFKNKDKIWDIVKIALTAIITWFISKL